LTNHAGGASEPPFEATTRYVPSCSRKIKAWRRSSPDRRPLVKRIRIVVPLRQWKPSSPLVSR
jgi:hypothetical protein